MPYVPTRDIITYYEEAGSGEPLVLIMGLGGDLQGWALTAPALAKHFRVITYDNRGAGRTGAPPTWTATSPACRSGSPICWAPRSCSGSPPAAPAR